MVIISTVSHDVVPETQHISIKVAFPDEIPPLYFKIKKTTKLTKIYNHIARKYGVSRHGGAFRLEFLGETLRVDDSTPEDMNMEDGDCLYLFWITRPGTAVGAEAESITLRVKMPDEIEPIYLRMKTTAKLFKLNNIIADQLGVSQDRNIFRLEFLGETLILDDSTPQEMHMEDWDCLYLFWTNRSGTDVETQGENGTIDVSVFKNVLAEKLSLDQFERRLMDYHWCQGCDYGRWAVHSF
ncbi:uncharacterized protein MELLADRAFT_101343 [Melampsora larici-populina 98AG31]|uniref:Rad60/SUMO-like domain-containing protein n=1 Tax=Melampsora larici-populina (strain 98AG31 / pathotype 3-4-7) TaxID=747676 RepID=F4R4F7_MELLP|nr:uncharacterized protein MELLADRAFT_101343 [Melampsora larici-populina 98AG31]EGG12802.1 hypothetical protein MELLADRAFT_101343 [Melampsora larici-populina 98AG31]